MQGPILFVSHDATRTGAPIALLSILKQIQRSGEPLFEVLLRGGGDIAPDFEALAPVSYWPALATSAPAEPSPTTGFWQRLVGDGGNGASAPAELTPVERFKARGVSLIYSNTITNGEVLAALAPLGVPVISHVHELDYWITHRIPGHVLQQARDHTDLFIAASGAVAECLSNVVQVPRDRIVTVHESIEMPDAAPSANRRDVRARWGIPEDAFVVGASGTMDWRKGVDLFAPLAAEAARQPAAQPFHWVWVGGEESGPVAGMVQHDFVRCGLLSTLHLAGTIEKPLELFSAFDAFVVLSREDPFPLVMLEAAAVGLPVLCFDGAGGAPEFVRDDAGFVVPYLDLPAMAARLSDLRAAPERRRLLGDTARQRVTTDHDVALVAPRIKGLIQQMLARGRG